MLRYTNKAISTAEMIARLIDLAKHLRDAQVHGEELGLSREETAFMTRSPRTDQRGRS